MSYNIILIRQAVKTAVVMGVTATILIGMGWSALLADIGDRYLMTMAS